MVTPGVLAAFVGCPGGSSASCPSEGVPVEIQPGNWKGEGSKPVSTREQENIWRAGFGGAFPNQMQLLDLGCFGRSEGLLVSGVRDLQCAGEARPR